MDKLLKYLTIALFMGFIFIVPIITLATPDKKVNEIENKILTQLPQLSINNIINKKFMNEFDKYTADQFPMRTDFIELKNSYSYVSGQREFRNIYLTKTGKLLERFTQNTDMINNNISTILNISNTLNADYNIDTKLMVVPTSIAFYNDELPSWAITDDVKSTINYINSKFNNTNLVDFYTPYKVLEQHKNNYIYFDTDHHWTQLGAKLAYEDMYNTKVSSTPTKVTENFYGTYYSKALLPNVNGDSIYAYLDFNDHKIDIDLSYTYDTLYDDTKLRGKNKYQYFLHGDPAIAIIDGNTNSNDEILIFKDSYAHSFIPFLTSNYKKIHVIDPRYYNVELYKYLDENTGINEVLFINNIQTFNSSPIFKN